MAGKETNTRVLGIGFLAVAGLLTAGLLIGFVGEPPEVDPSKVEFYETDVEAHSVIWCLDRSGSMHGQPIEILRAELENAIWQLDPVQSFGIVAFSSEVDVFRPSLVPATDENKELAVRWVGQLRAFGWSCLADGVTAALALSRDETEKRQALVLVGDGQPFCGSKNGYQGELTVELLRRASLPNTSIHTIFIGSERAGQSYYRELSTTFGGTYHER